MNLIGIGALDPKNQPWNTEAYEECAGKKIQACGSLQGEAQLACIDKAQSACLAEAMDKLQLRWFFIGAGCGAVAVALIWKSRKKGLSRA